VAVGSRRRSAHVRQAVSDPVQQFRVRRTLADWKLGGLGELRAVGSHQIPVEKRLRAAHHLDGTGAIDSNPVDRRSPPQVHIDMVFQYVELPELPEVFDVNKKRVDVKLTKFERDVLGLMVDVFSSGERRLVRGESLAVTRTINGLYEWGWLIEFGYRQYDPLTRMMDKLSDVFEYKAKSDYYPTEITVKPGKALLQLQREHYHRDVYNLFTEEDGEKKNLGTMKVVLDKGTEKVSTESSFPELVVQDTSAFITTNKLKRLFIKMQLDSILSR